MSRVLILLLLFFIVGCQNELPEKNNLPPGDSQTDSQQDILPTENPKPLTQEDYQEQVKMMDTLTARGNYLHYSLDDSSNTIITWGNLKTGDIGKFVSEKYPGWAPHWYLNEWRNYIGLRYECGSPCWDLTLLPLNKKDKIFSVMEDLAWDTARGFVFCRSEKENRLFCVVNVNTRKEQEIKLPGIDKDYLMTSSIDSCAFVEKGLYVRWKAVMKVEPYAETREKTFKINLRP